ncbi:MAG: AAA family ATPase [Legionella sp.]
MIDEKRSNIIDSTDVTDHAYKPAAWMTKVAFIQQLVLTDNVLISVLGEQGTGKSTFAHLLHTTLGAEITPCLLTASPLFNSERCLTALNAKLDFSGEATVANIVAQCNTHNQHILLIIDDAQFLPAMFIEQLFRAIHQQTNPSYFHVCLISNFNLVNCLNELAQPYGELIHSIELAPLTEPRTNRLIQERISAKPNINELADAEQTPHGHLTAMDSELNPDGLSRPVKQASFTIKTVAASFVIVGLLGIIYLSLQYSSPSQKNITDIEQHLPQPTIVAPNSMIPEQATAVLTSEIPAYDEPSSTWQTIQPLPKQPEPYPAPLLEKAIDQVSTEVINKVEKNKKQQLIPSVAPTKIKKMTTVKAVPSVLKKPVNHRPMKSLSVVKGQFTIQLLASYNKRALQYFVKKYHVNNTEIMLTTFQGKPWYILVLGHYQKKEDARFALTRLPPNLIKLKPWIRITANLRPA